MSPTLEPGVNTVFVELRLGASPTVIDTSSLVVIVGSEPLKNVSLPTIVKSLVKLVVVEAGRSVEPAI